MKSFRDYLTEAQMTPAEALKVFDLPRGFSAEELKAKHKELALKNHPDRGGDLEAMKLVNIAYDVLSRSTVTFSGADRDSYADRKAKEKAFQDIAAAAVESKLDANAFRRHFETIFAENFTYTKKVQPLSGSVQFTLEFSNYGNTTVLELVVSANYLSLYREASLATDGVGMDMYVSTEILHNRRKVKLTQKSFTLTNQVKILSDPEETFPAAKLKSQTKKDKARKFAKRDALLTIEKELKAEYRSSDGGWFYIPVGEYTVLIYRYTFMGIASWGFNGLYLKHKRVSMLPVITLIEDEASINWFVDEMKKVQNLSSEADIQAAIGKMVTEYKARPR